MKAPFPYCGGKSRISSEVWTALGQPKHYLEPFFGSGAVLLNRPSYNPQKHVETVCDKDGNIANVWRAIQFSPDETAKWCDWPVNHADLMARKKVLIASQSRLLENLINDDMWHDVKLAGYWIWGASCWIGSGLMCPTQRPIIGHAGEGVHKIGQIPQIGNAGGGVHKISKRPALSHAGTGVHKIGQLSGDGIYAWFATLSTRLRRVRIVCGDWTRICGGNWQDDLGTVGIYFDPPYSHDVGRCTDIYAQESADVAKEVARWAVERGSKPTYRIVLSGYTGEHDWLAEHGWRYKQWTAQGGYANIGNDDSPGKANRFREVLWLSPHCAVKQERLFE
jgi:hypothetical protein